MPLSKDIIQEDICKYCEEFILECSSMLSTFLCEGTQCELAEELFNIKKEDEQKSNFQK